MRTNFFSVIEDTFLLEVILVVQITLIWLFLVVTVSVTMGCACFLFSVISLFTWVLVSFHYLQSLALGRLLGHVDLAVPDCPDLQILLSSSKGCSVLFRGPLVVV